MKLSYTLTNLFSPHSIYAEPTATHLLSTPQAERMYIDASEIIRLRVESDEFNDDEPGPVKVVNGEVVRDEEREREWEREGRKRKGWISHRYH